MAPAGLPTEDVPNDGDVPGTLRRRWVDRDRLCIRAEDDVPVHRDVPTAVDGQAGVSCVAEVAASCPDVRAVAQIDVVAVEPSAEPAAEPPVVLYDTAFDADVHADPQPDPGPCIGVDYPDVLEEQPSDIREIKGNVSIAIHTGGLVHPVAVECQILNCKVCLGRRVVDDAPVLGCLELDGSGAYAHPLQVNAGIEHDPPGLYVEQTLGKHHSAKAAHGIN